MDLSSEKEKILQSGKLSMPMYQRYVYDIWLIPNRIHTFGYPSIKMWTVSLAMVSVVQNTITENNIVQAGSAHI